MSKKRTQYEKAASAAARLLQSEDGKFLMQFLKSRTVDESNLPEAAVDGHAMAIMMAFKEGEKNLYRYIESLVKKGKNNA